MNKTSFQLNGTQITYALDHDLSLSQKKRWNQIKKFWTSKKRRTDWDTIRWAPFALVGNKFTSVGVDDVKKNLDHQGYFFYWWESAEKTEEEWEATLMYWLHIWYNLPEDLEVPLYVNEEAKVICVLGKDYTGAVPQIARLEDGALLDMMQLDIEKETRPAKESIFLPLILRKNEQGDASTQKENVH